MTVIVHVRGHSFVTGLRTHINGKVSRDKLSAQTMCVTNADMSRLLRVSDKVDAVRLAGERGLQFYRCTCAGGPCKGGIAERN